MKRSKRIFSENIASTTKSVVCMLWSIPFNEIGKNKAKYKECSNNPVYVSTSWFTLLMFTTFNISSIVNISSF